MSFRIYHFSQLLWGLTNKNPSNIFHPILFYRRWYDSKKKENLMENSNRKLKFEMKHDRPK